MNRTTAGTRAVALIGLAFWVVFGTWAFAAPASFYDAVAAYPPFNAHFLRDAGAFMLGLGGGLAAGLWWRDALAAALAGSGVAAVFHTAGHVIDRELGGSLGDTLGLAVLALALVVAAAAQRRREVRS